jgi:hypothetical protein
MVVALALEVRNPTILDKIIGRVGRMPEPTEKAGGIRPALHGDGVRGDHFDMKLPVAVTVSPSNVERTVYSQT